MHLPDCFQCHHRSCSWRGSRHDELREHLNTVHGGHDYLVARRPEEFEIYDRKLVLALAHENTELATECALALVEERARELGKEELWRDLRGNRPKVPHKAFERVTTQVGTITTATHRTRARVASHRSKPDLPESPHAAGPSVGAERVRRQEHLLRRLLKQRSDVTGGLNEAVDNPSRPRDTDLLMQGLSVTSHKPESHIPANLEADSIDASGHMHVPLTTHQQYPNANSTPPSHTQEYIPAPPSVSFRIMTPLDDGYSPTPSDPDEVQRRTAQGQTLPQVNQRPDVLDELGEAGDAPSRPEDTDLPMQRLADAPNDAPRRDSTSPNPTQGHIPSSPSVSLHINTPPDKLHPTLSSWIKNMKKLSSLIDPLQELASSAPETHRSQLSRQVVTLRETFKRQQERCVEFLQLSEEYATRYLLDISGEIQQQSAFLEMLEKRLDMAKMLRGEAVALRKSHESGTVAAFKDVRETGKAVSSLLQK